MAKEEKRHNCWHQKLRLTRPTPQKRDFTCVFRQPFFRLSHRQSPKRIGVFQKFQCRADLVVLVAREVELREHLRHLDLPADGHRRSYRDHQERISQEQYQWAEAQMKSQPCQRNEQQCCPKAGAAELLRQDETFYTLARLEEKLQ